MPASETLSQYSDWTYTTTVVIYVLALLFFLVEQAFGRKGRQAALRQAQRPRELATAGAPAGADAGPDDAGTADGSGTADDAGPPADAGTTADEPVGRAERAGRMGAALTVLGALLHLGALVSRGIATERVPWGNMYEYEMAVTLVAVVTWLVILKRYSGVRHLSAFVLLPVVILMFVGGTVLYATAAPVQPALQSYWLAIHVSAAAISSGIFLVPGIASVLYLLQSRHESDPSRVASLANRLPSKDVLDRIAYRVTVLAFPVFTFGVLCGAVWAESAWGRFWGWDPKETTAFVAWVVYAAYLHSRATAGWRGNRAAMINVLGFAVMIFNLFFVNLVTSGLHSYAGVS